MKAFTPLYTALAVGLVLIFVASKLMAQTNASNAEAWLAAAPVAPDFTVPKTKAAWDKQRTEVRATLRQLLGKLPPRPKVPKVTITTREDRGDYVFEKFNFDNGAGASVPGYVFLPKGVSGKSPAILYCHWHGGQYDIGKDELLRTNAVPVPPGPTLARRGYVVLGVDAYCFGERNGQGPGGPTEKGGAGEMTASKFNLWAGRSLWGMILRDDLMALDYLASRKEVDASRIGVTGISMGATRTWWLAALDERLRAGVAVACMTRYSDLIRTEGLKYHGIYYFVPGMLNHFDSEAVMALAAPRPMLYMTGDKDFGSPVEGIRKLEAKLRPAYGLYRAEANFENVVYPGLGHVYLPEMWDKMVRWMDRHVRDAK
ncbi:MAG: dienelactone hydrolase [Verrucomicrobia bacterium]|nr:dienelactone hydrolase [Verrucomicrobiota bacterium]